MKSKGKRIQYRRSGKRRRPWMKKEDKAIRTLVKTVGTKNWSLVAEKLLREFRISGRTGKQCRERWHNHLDSGISKEPWSLQEELTLFQRQSLVGNKWAEISVSIPGRTDNSVKNHFYSTLRKQYRKSFGADASPEHLHENEKFLTSEVLLALTHRAGSFSQAKEEFFRNIEIPLSPPDLPELFDIEETDLFVTGHRIPLPPSNCFQLEEEFPVEFKFGNCEYMADEVFMMPFSGSEDYEF